MSAEAFPVKAYSGRCVYMAVRDSVAVCSLHVDVSTRRLQAASLPATPRAVVMVDFLPLKMQFHC